MKAGVKIMLLIGILLLAAGLTVLQIAHHRGESFSANLTVFNTGFSGNFDFDQKDYTVLVGGEESFSAREVRTLKLDWISGSLSVERWDGKDLVVRETSSVSLAEDESARWRLSGGTLSILPCANSVRSLPEKQLTVLVPQGLTLEGLDVDVASASARVSALEITDRLAIDAASGSLRVEDCVCGTLGLRSASGSQSVLRTRVNGDADADLASGSFQAEGLDCAALSVDSASGSQTLDALACDTLRLETASGAIRAEGLLCRGADVDGGSGAIRLGFDAAPDKVKVESSSGGVTLAFPKGTGLDLSFDSGSGRLRGELVYGELPVEVDTASGNLTIEYK